MVGGREGEGLQGEKGRGCRERRGGVAGREGEGLEGEMPSNHSPPSDLSSSLPTTPLSLLSLPPTLPPLLSLQSLLLPWISYLTSFHLVVPSFLSSTAGSRHAPTLQVSAHQLQHPPPHLHAGGDCGLRAGECQDTQPHCISGPVGRYVGRGGREVGKEERK